MLTKLCGRLSTQTAYFFPMARMFSNNANYNLNYKGNFNLQESQQSVMNFTANNLWDNPGSRRFKRQVGRGPGSGKG